MKMFFIGVCFWCLLGPGIYGGPSMGPAGSAYGGPAAPPPMGGQYAQPPPMMYPGGGAPPPPGSTTGYDMNLAPGPDQAVAQPPHQWQHQIPPPQPGSYV